MRRRIRHVHVQLQDVAYYLRSGSLSDCRRDACETAPSPLTKAVCFENSVFREAGVSLGRICGEVSCDREKGLAI